MIGRIVSRHANQAGSGLIEVLVALVLMSIGLLAVAGISLSVAAQTNLSTWRTDQTLAAQEVLERVQQAGFTAATSGTDTVSIGNRTYTVNRTVTVATPRVKQIQVTVVSSREIASRTFTTHLYQASQLPPPP